MVWKKQMTVDDMEEQMAVDDLEETKAGEMTYGYTE
jgi:hypothetical protein